MRQLTNVNMKKLSFRFPVVRLTDIYTYIHRGFQGKSVIVQTLNKLYIR
jgi:hypothetical protein